METVFIRQNEKHLKISTRDILYLEASGSYLKLVTTLGEFSLSQNLSQFMRKNAIPNLMRVHRSYVINLTRVESFDNQYLYVGTVQIPISDTHRVEFMSKVRCL